MSVRFHARRPGCFTHFPAGQYDYCELFKEDGGYGFAALAEHADSIELHLELTRWGPQVCRSLMRDAAWLQGYAARRGKRRIVGIRQETGKPDPRWPKFTRLLGFTGQTVLQAAFCEVEPVLKPPKNPAVKPVAEPA